MFDPYRKWLGIPEDQRPPTHYQLLGISPDEQDIDVIEAAVLRQSAFVRNFQSGQHAEEATRLLNEFAAARICLLDRQKRSKYDAELRKKRGDKPASQSSASHSDLAIPATAAIPGAAPAPRPAPALDLEQLTLPTPPRRAAATGRRTTLRQPALGRRRTQQASVGYVWQVPLVTVVILILMVFARLIGRSIAEQRGLYTRPVQVEQPSAE
ncbi:MAG TPA: hypothetical protein VHC22_09550 [Pirellulales bacterium]|nr:hypothetical protein [Pirellulales bacterium]